MSPIDPRELRAAFGTFLTGVTVVSATTEDGLPIGFTANSYTSVSMDPPLLLVCPAKSLNSYSVFESCKHFTVNILNESQQDVSNIFASSGEDRFEQINWSNDAFGSPLIDGVSASFSCSVFNRTDAGDHLILVGQVEQFTNTGKPGLGYSPNGYFSLEMERAAASLGDRDHSVKVGAIIEHQGSVLLKKSATGYHPPNIEAEHTGSLASAQKLFSDAGLHIDIGPVYSIFDHSATAEVCTYYRGTAEEASTGNLGEYVPIRDLHHLEYSDRAISIMMQRYATERENGVFGLYVGDESRGDVHLFGEGRNTQ